jgi:hypothetical protein
MGRELSGGQAAWNRSTPSAGERVGARAANRRRGGFWQSLGDQRLPAMICPRAAGSIQCRYRIQAKRAQLTPTGPQRPVVRLLLDFEIVVEMFPEGGVARRAPCSPAEVHKLPADDS